MAFLVGQSAVQNQTTINLIDGGQAGDFWFLDYLVLRDTGSGTAPPGWLSLGAGFTNATNPDSTYISMRKAWSPGDDSTTIVDLNISGGGSVPEAIVQLWRGLQNTAADFVAGVSPNNGGNPLNDITTTARQDLCRVVAMAFSAQTITSPNAADAGLVTDYSGSNIRIDHVQLSGIGLYFDGISPYPPFDIVVFYPITGYGQTLGMALVSMPFYMTADIPVPRFTATIEAQDTSPPHALTQRFDAGVGSSWFVIPQLSDSGDELRSKNAKAFYVIGKTTNGAGRVYPYDVGQEINIADMENDVRTTGATRSLPIADKAQVAQSKRQQINVTNAVMHTIRISGDGSEREAGDTLDRVDQITYEVDRQGVRR